MKNLTKCYKILFKIYKINSNEGDNLFKKKKNFIKIFLEKDKEFLENDISDKKPLLLYRIKSQQSPIKEETDLKEQELSHAEDISALQINKNIESEKEDLSEEVKIIKTTPYSEGIINNSENIRLIFDDELKKKDIENENNSNNFINYQDLHNIKNENLDESKWICFKCIKPYASEGSLRNHLNGQHNFHVSFT